MSAPSTTYELPQNGIPGLKHWRYDLLAGLLVAIVSLPLSLGIAVASGAPPITGLTSAIIAGLIVPFIGGTYVTISGPAAGLAPAILSGMLLLGQGDKEKGYPLLLAAISIVADLNNVVGWVLCTAMVAWSTITATRFFEYSFDMEDKKYLIAYPIILFYSVFMLLTLF